MGIASSRFIAAAFSVAIIAAAFATASAQSADPKGAEPRQQNGEGGKEGKKSIDEFAEAAQLLEGAAANPECLWLGRRVVSLLWRDDLDTAFRHLDLYDRFGCPAGHIQVTFRCVVRQGKIDEKAPDALNGRVHGCWINPNFEAAAAATAAVPSAAAPAPTTNR
jgi:hypothetical protein